MRMPLQVLYARCGHANISRTRPSAGDDATNPHSTPTLNHDVLPRAQKEDGNGVVARIPHPRHLERWIAQLQDGGAADGDSFSRRIGHATMGEEWQGRGEKD